MPSDTAICGVPPLVFEPVTDVLTDLGESPVWDERRNALFWCDIPNGTVWQYSPLSGAVREIRFEGRTGSLGLCESGRLIVACERDLLLADPDTGVRVHLLTIEEDFAGRLNDGRVGPDGAFWVGSVADRPLAELPPVANLWRVTLDGARRMATGLKCSNGLAFARDGKTMMHSDSVAKWVGRQAFDSEDASLGPAGA